MNIVKNQIDNLNVVLSVTIDKEDYQPQVDKTLKEYRKTANIPGFRKGFVPEGIIKKQYGKAVQYDEINRLLDKSLNEYLVREKINYLGNPLPLTNDIDWEAQTLTFDFELGLVPDFELNLKPEQGIRFFEIKIDESLVDTQIERIQTQFGTNVSQEQVADNSQVKGLFFNEKYQIDKQTTVSVESLSEQAKKEFIGKKVGEQLTLSTENLFNDTHELMHHLGVTHEQSHHLQTQVIFTIEEIFSKKVAELNQELFDKLFPSSEVTSIEQLKDKIRENIQVQYENQSEQQLLNDVTDYLIDSTSFELPSLFLKKWLRTVGEKQLTIEEAEQEYEKSEKGLRYQLIESKIVADNKLQISYENLKDFAQENIKNQMLQFGMTPDEQQVDDIVKRILKNREEVERLNQQLLSKKLVAFYKENVSLQKKVVSYDEFIKEVYPNDNN